MNTRARYGSSLGATTFISPEKQCPAGYILDPRRNNLCFPAPVVTYDMAKTPMSGLGQYGQPTFWSSFKHGLGITAGIVAAFAAIGFASKAVARIGDKIGAGKRRSWRSNNE